MSYKTGDRLLCKKDYIWRKRILFIKGNYYGIISIKNDSVMFTDEEKDSFSINKINEIFKHFLTKQEQRKIKLERLQCIK